MKLRPRALRQSHRRHDRPVCTVADYLRQTQPLEYALLCAIAGVRDYAAADGQAHWQISVHQPLADLDRIMRQAPRSAKVGGNE